MTKKLWDKKKISLCIVLEHTTHISWLYWQFFIGVFPFWWELKFVWQPGERTLSVGPFCICYINGLTSLKYKEPVLYNDLFVKNYEDVN